MNRDQFLRALKAYCRKTGLAYRQDLKRGKGGHGTVWVGKRFTVIPSGELKKGLQEGVLKALGLPKDAV